MDAVSHERECAASSPQPTTVILPFEKQGEFFVEDLGELPEMPLYCAVKRALDIVLSALALFIFALPMLGIAVAVRCASAGTVLYMQERLGQNGRRIRIVKFRTMHMNAEADGAQWSRGDDDPRIFPLGRRLRRSHLDELPQFWSVLRGDLTLVGPRPERECFYTEFETYIHNFRERLKVKPGLTGLAQINGGYDLKPEEKILYDVAYIKKRSLGLDLKILAQTAIVVFTHHGAR